MTMSIKVRYFASLKESLGRSEDDLEFEGIATVSDVWRRANAGKPLPDNLLAAVNMEYVDRNSIVKDGDEVAFFPPVTGG
jgi:molybdopterin synthase sulfur carrier subunit